MKTLKFILASAAIISITLISCKKEEPIAPTPNDACCPNSPLPTPGNSIVNYDSVKRERIITGVIGGASDTIITGFEFKNALPNCNGIEILHNSFPGGWTGIEQGVAFFYDMTSGVELAVGQGNWSVTITGQFVNENDPTDSIILDNVTHIKQ